MLYWLKLETDIDTYGYIYDTHCFPIDTKVSSLDLDNPIRKYTVKKIIGNGASISGGASYGDRIIAISRRFIADSSSTTGAMSADREDFLYKYIMSNIPVYLIRDYNGTLQYIRVYPTMGAEKYKKLIVSENFDIKLMCELPFFQSVTPVVSSTFTKTTKYKDVAITNRGVPTPVIFECTFDGNDTYFTMGVYDNYGCTVTYSFVTNDTLKIDSADLRVWINDIERFNVITAGTPFNLNSGDTTLRLESTAALSGCKTTYTERNI